MKCRILLALTNFDFGNNCNFEVFAERIREKGLPHRVKK
jgi:hypothetical protein